jgi:hypothetical protein
VLGLRDHITVNSYIAKTRTPGLSGDDTSYRFQFDYSSDRYGFVVERLTIGDHFHPDMGHVQRDDVRALAPPSASAPAAPEQARAERSSGSYQTDRRRRELETRLAEGSFDIEFQNSDRLSAQYQSSFEHLEKPFAIRGSRFDGGYGFRDASVRCS